MRKLLTFFGLLFMSAIAYGQIQTITIDDFAVDSTEDTRLAGFLEDGSLVPIDAICIDSNNCLWIKDTFGLKRGKLVVDSTVINLIFFRGGGGKIIKNININKRIVNVCGAKKFQKKFGNIFCESTFIDSFGVITIYRDTTTVDTAIIIIEDVANCRTIRASSKSDVIIISGMDSTGSYQRVIGPMGNSIDEVVLPDDCVIGRSSSKSDAVGFERWDSSGYTIGAIDSTGKTIEQTFDFENCKITYSSSLTDNNLMIKIDSNGVTTTTMDSSGNSMMELVDPAGCSRNLSTPKAPVSVTDQIDSSGYSITARNDSTEKEMGIKFDLDSCKVTFASSATDNNLMFKIDDSGVSRIIMDSLGGVVEMIDPETGQILILPKNPTDPLNMIVAGGFSAEIKNFMIDHPLDPENKYLIHSSIEGPERFNLYNGHIITGEKGYAKVQMPGYFMALNRDFEYNVTVIGKTFARAVVWEEMGEDGSFVIRTDEPNVKVSWQVIGIRKDRAALENPLQVEISKAEFHKSRVE